MKEAYGIFIIGLLLCLPLGTMAQSTLDTDTVDSELRMNPSFLPQFEPAGEYSDYPFLNLSENYIRLNSDDWTGLRSRLSEGILYGPAFSIVHIGDSHIQADGATGVTRRILQQHFGNAGRGLVTPLKMAGTNEPRDYAITSTGNWKTAKLMKTPWETEMQFTGVAVSPHSPEFDLTVSTLSRTLEINPFSELTIFYEGEASLEAIGVSSQGENLFFIPEPADGSLTLLLTKSVTEAEIKLKADGKVIIGGITLGNMPNGLFYHTIGNNGATYISYNNLGKMGRVGELCPDLVILSMGANEAFGKLTDEEFAASISAMIADISAASPNTKFLLVTPMECQRRQGRRGRKRATSYSVNPNILRLRNVILRYGKDHGIPVYDFYAVAGGEGASDKWISRNLMNTDRIHNTWTGYELQGRLLADAIIDLFVPSPKIN